MPLTVLFDLDDTLLSTNMDRFLHGYFEILAQALEQFGSKERITQQIQYAVQKMIANTDPSKTLKEVFDQHFYGPLGTTEEDCLCILEAFYRDEYPHLKPITQTRPEVIELVDWCRSKGMIIAIATNPLFPQTATCQRIQWAGLDPEEFTFFTAYEDFHFTKPNLAYYAEVIGRLGWPEGPIVMVGDDFSLDLLPMQTMGFETFWIKPENQENHPKSGTLSDVKPWLTKISHNRKANHHPEVNFAILQSTPAVFDSWLRHETTNELRKLPSHQMEQMTNVLLNLANSEIEVFHPHFKTIQNSSKPLTTMNSTPKEGQLSKLDPNHQESFSSFLAARQTTLSMITDLSKNSEFDKSTSINHDTSITIDALLEVISLNDRQHLRECVNMLNIYKIY